jgi:hypothetical protein
MMFGMVECGVCRNTRKEFSVIEASAAMAGKVGDFGFADASFGWTPWHWEHHCSAKTRPLAPSAFAWLVASSTTRTIAMKTAQIVLGPLIASPIRNPWSIIVGSEAGANLRKVR